MVIELEEIELIFYGVFNYKLYVVFNILCRLFYLIFIIFCIDLEGCIVCFIGE